MHILNIHQSILIVKHLNKNIFENIIPASDILSVLIFVILVLCPIFQKTSLRQL